MAEFFKKKKELFLLGGLFILLFLAEAYDDKHAHFYWFDFFFVLQYLLASLFISYILIPRFLYRRKWLIFGISICLTFIAVGIIEEFVLEQIFYPTSRGHVTLVLHTFLEIFPPIFILVGFKFAWDALTHRNKIETLNRIVAENELQFLNSQINPHFLFNNLNNIYAFALENSPKTPKLILQLSSILRYMLYDCRKPLVDISDEIDNLNQFIALYKMQVGEKAKVDFKYWGEDSQLQIAPLILIVFVENAFKHSQASQIDTIQILTSIQIQNKILNFKCENTYGKESNTSGLDNGIGLANVKSKLKLLYPDKHKLEIQQDELWFRISLQIEL